jgi:thymidine kinase
LDVDAEPVDRSEDILKKLDPSTTVVGVDEVQFFDEGIIDVVESLADQGVRVIVTGLDMDFRGEPFGCMPDLIAKAEKVEKLQAICMVCGGSASRTQRLVNGEPAHYEEPIVVVGAQEMYEARCRQHHQVPKG